MADDLSTMRSAESNFETRVAAPRETVWKALVDRPSDWWHRDFYAGSTPRGFIVEAKLGGRVYEDWGDGDGAVWYVVTALRRGALLTLAGDVTCGGPLRVVDTITLDDDGDGTRLKITSLASGRLAAGWEAQVADGWRTLFEGCLKPYVETGVKPDRPATVA